MGIVSALKSLLGIDASRSHREEPIDSPAGPADDAGDVEYEAATERAVKEPVESTEPVADDSAEAEPVDVIKGIGPAYSERLAAVGIETVDELAAADSEDLAEETGIGSSRLESWVARAKAR